MTTASLLGTIDLGPGQLALAAALILLNAAASIALKLGLERRLLTAAVRCDRAACRCSDSSSHGSSPRPGPGRWWE